MFSFLPANDVAPADALAPVALVDPADTDAVEAEPEEAEPLVADEALAAELDEDEQPASKTPPLRRAAPMPVSFRTSRLV